MFVDLDWPLNASSLLSASAELLVCCWNTGNWWSSYCNQLLTRAVMVLKPKPKTAVLRWNQTATELRFSGGHVTVFLEFQKWPSPVTNVPKQQPNYRLSRTPTSTVSSDRLTARSGVARQPNYSPWQVDLCAAVGAVRTDVVHTGGLPALRQICEWRGRKYTDWRTRFYDSARHWRAFLIPTQFTGSPTRRRYRPYLFAFDFSSWQRCYVPKSHVRCL